MELSETFSFDSFVLVFTISSQYYIKRGVLDILDTSTFRIAGARSGGRRRHSGTEAVGCDSQWGHVFLGLKQDDMNFGGEEAAENHRTTQTDGDAHGGGLHLWGDGEWVVKNLSAYTWISTFCLQKD